MAFQCRRAALDASSLLSGLAINHPDNGWYVMSPMLSSIDPDDFFPVGQYLARGEYNPNLLDDNTEWVRLERELEGDTRNEEVIRCGKIYCTAQKLEVSGLQDLAFRKLKALAKDTPYEAFAILCVTALAFTIGNEDLRQYLVRYLAEHFMEMIPVAGEKLVEVMTSDGDLQRSVFGLMSGILPEVQDAGVEGVQKEETEGKEGDVGGVTGAEVLGSAGLGGDEVEDERVRMDMREFVKMREQEEAFQPLD